MQGRRLRVARPKAEQAKDAEDALGRWGKKVMNFEIVLSAKYLSFQPWKENQKSNLRNVKWQIASRGRTDIFADTANVTGFFNDEKIPLGLPFFTVPCDQTCMYLDSRYKYSQQCFPSRYRYSVLYLQTVQEHSKVKLKIEKLCRNGKAQPQQD